MNVTELCLQHLGVSSKEKLNQWFEKSNQNQYRIQGLAEAAEMLKEFKNDTVVICGDYDADGTCATAILMHAFQSAGFQNVSFKIPYRHTEGFGLNQRMVEEIKKEHAGEKICLITVDNGMAATGPVALAKLYGMTVIVTDHHMENRDEKGNKILPGADFVIDPSALPETADYDGYCGAGIAYKLALELIGPIAKRLRPLAAIATIADVMELREENYVIARYGIDSLSRKEPMPIGLYQLMKVFDLDQVTEHDIGFKIAPALNAPGRLEPDGARFAVELLTTPDVQMADYLAHKLYEMNETRKKMITEAVEKVDKRCSDHVVYIPQMNVGLTGNVAPKFGKLIVALTENTIDPEILVGSARSIPTVNMKAVLDSISDCLVKYGGHEGAAGLSVEKKRLKEFSERFEQALLDLNVDLTEETKVQADLTIRNADVEAVLQECSTFYPFGNGNPQPVFEISDFKTVLNYGKRKSETKDGKTVKLKSVYCEAVGFGLAEKMESCPDPKELKLVGTLGYNTFRGNTTIQMEFVDFEIIR